MATVKDHFGNMETPLHRTRRDDTRTVILLELPEQCLRFHRCEQIEFRWPCKLGNNPNFGVILSEAKNLSSIYAKSAERFSGETHASETTKKSFFRILPSQARHFVASCTHGKQKRTKTRKEKTEEAKSLVTQPLLRRDCPTRAKSLSMGLVSRRDGCFGSDA
jgi:hypothetical protein